MAERLAYLEAVVGADVSNFRRGMSDVRNEVGFLSDSMKGLAGVGRGLTFAFTAPMIALGSATVAAASTFQASMYNINAIAGLTGSELDALSQRALEFGANTRSGAQNAADALYTVFSAGISSTEDAFAAMQVATYTAEAGLADLTVTTESMLAVMLAYGDTGEDMAWRVSNALTQMVAVGVGSMEEFAGALGNVVPTAQGLGMSIEELMGDMAFLTQRGLSAAKAGTALNSALTALIKPSEAMSAAMHELGAGSSQELIENFGGVNGALEALIKHAGGSQEALAAMFGNIRGLRAVNLFAGDVDGWTAAIAEFNGALDGATLRAWESQMQSFSASWDMLQSAVQGAAIAIGTKLFPILQPIVDGLRGLIIQLTTVSPELMAMAVGFTAIAAAAPPILWVIASLISPLGLVVGAVTALGVAFSTNFLGIKDVVVGAVAGVVTALQPLTNVLSGFWNELFPEEDELSDKITKGLDVRIPNPLDVVSIDPTGGAISLWQFYEDEGYISRVSWDEFMAHAVEGGWQGGAITPDSPLTFSLGDAIEVEVPDDPLGIGELKANNDKYLREATPLMRSAVADSMQSVFSKLWAVAEPELTAIGALLLAWFDAQGTKIVAAVAAWADGIDPTALLASFKSMLDGGWGWIAGSLSGGGDALVTGVGGWGDKIEEALPQLTSSFSALVSSTSDWLRTDGVALISNGVGYLGGAIGLALGEAISDGIEFLSGLSGTIDTSGLGFIQTDILAPMLEGFEDTGVLKRVTKWGNGLSKRIVGSLLTMKNDAVSWVDTNGALFFDALTSWITGIDTAALYTSFTTLLNNIFSGGDGAVTSSVDSVGVQIQASILGWGTKITETLPRLTASVTTFMGTLGSFFLDEGIPLLAQSMGFLSGKIAVLLYNSVQAGIALFSGGGGGGGVGTVVGDYIENGLIAPFQTGMEDATAGSSLAGDIWSTLGDDIELEMAGGITGINTTTITDAMGVKLSEFGTWLKVEGINSLSEGIGYMTGRIGYLFVQGIQMAIGSITGMGADTEMGEVGIDVAGSFQTGFQNAMGDVGVEGTFDQLMVGIAGAMVIGATATRFKPVIWAIGAAMNGAASLGGWALKSGSSMVVNFAQAMATRAAASGAWTGVTTSVTTGLSTAFANVTAMGSAIASSSAWATISSSIMAAITSSFAAVGFGLVLGTAVYLMIPDETLANWRQNIADAFDSLGLGMTYDDMMVTVNSVAVNAAGAAVDLIMPDSAADSAAAAVWADMDWAAYFESQGLVVDMPPIGDGTPIVSEPASMTIAPEVVDIDLTNASLAFADQLMQGEEAGTIIAEQFLPLEMAWVSMFGEEGTMTLASGIFAAKTIAGFTDTGIAATTMAMVLETFLPPMVATTASTATGIQTEMRRIITITDAATAAIQGFVGALRNLADASTTLKVDVQVAGNFGGVDGSHAGGLANVPYDGYIAELHKGERVMPANENKEYSSHAISSGTGSNVTTTSVTNYVTIQSDGDTDKLIRDLKRRGIVIDG